MKISHIIFLSVYVTCIICGFSIGKTLKKTESAETILPSVFALHQSIPTLKNGQHNLLVIAVDNLDLQQPQLRSVWLVTYFQNNPSITFLPISPTISSGDVIVDQMLSDSFVIVKADGNTNISTSFFDTLTRRNFWWSGYLIVDEFAFTSVLNEKSFLADNHQLASSEININDLGNISQDPQNLYDRYTQIFQDACRFIAQQGNDFNWQFFSSLIPQHVITDFDANLLIDEWTSSIKTIEAPNCYFPLDTLYHAIDRQ
jgi:hypothetical protein